MARRRKAAPPLTDDDLVARFIKYNGVTECPQGMRRHSEKQYQRAEFGEVDLRQARGRVHGAIDPTEAVVEFKFRGRTYRKNAHGEWMQ